MVRLSRASRPIKFINSDVVTAGVRSRANCGSTSHFGVVHNIVVRLSRASRPIKFMNSDVVTAGIRNQANCGSTTHFGVVHKAAPVSGVLAY